MEVLLREDKSLARKVTLKNDRLQKYFPPSYTPKQMEEVDYPAPGSVAEKENAGTGAMI